ncbi:MAG: hypothetical protein RIC56_03070 [Pseudomonadales bacterium]
MNKSVALCDFLLGSLLVSLLVSQAGCHTPADDPPSDGTAAAERPREARERLLSDMPPAGEVPESLLEEIRSDLRTRVGSDRPLIVNRAEPVVWPSGAMGCPVPGMAYTQALVPGYHVVFEVDGDRWDYRANQGGAFRLCESAGGRETPDPASP